MRLMRMSDIVKLLPEIGKSYKLVVVGEHTIQRVADFSNRVDFCDYKICYRGKCLASLCVLRENGKITKENVIEAVRKQKERLVRAKVVDDLDDLENLEPQKLMEEAKEVVEEAKKVDVKECVESLKEQMENEPLVPLGSCSLMHDAVNHPSHYNQGGIECIEAIESATIGKKGIEAVCVANVIKYLWRYELKGGIESVKKAKWYLEKLLEKMEGK